MTVIYPSPIFGPVHSRRLGVSLGINLMPGDGKVCTFDCVYCECGFNKDFRPKSPRPTREEVRRALEARLIDMQQNGPAPDVLTFAGNGEPTAHPHFPEIIESALRLLRLHLVRSLLGSRSSGCGLIGLPGILQPLDLGLHHAVLYLAEQQDRLAELMAGRQDGPAAEVVP